MVITYYIGLFHYYVIITHYVIDSHYYLLLTVELADVGLRIVSFWLNMTVDRRGQNRQAPVSVSEPASASASTLQSIEASEPSSSGSAVAAKYHQQECQKKHSMYSHSLLCTVTVVYGQILAKGREGKRTYRVVQLICLVSQPKPSC